MYEVAVRASKYECAGMDSVPELSAPAVFTLPEFKEIKPAGLFRRSY